MQASLITFIVQPLLVLERFFYYRFSHHKNLFKMVLISNVSDENSLTHEIILKKEEHYFLFYNCSTICKQTVVFSWPFVML